MNLALIHDLQQQFNDVIAEHEAENDLRNLSQRQMNRVSEQQSLDRMNELGALAMSIQDAIGEELKRESPI